MKQGVLVYDPQSERMDVRFGLREYRGGLHILPESTETYSLFQNFS